MSLTESVDLKYTVPIPSTSSSGERLSYYRKTLMTAPAKLVRTNCNKCPSCIHIRNINEYSHETTPLIASSINLLRDARCYDKSLIALFVLIVLFGSGIGIYLLFVESEGAIIEEFDYVSRASWGVNITFLKDVPPLHRPVSKVLLVELIINCTDTSNHCLQFEEFEENNKEKMKIFNGKVLYNFYQDVPGRIFEGRGWNFQSDCGQENGCDDTLTIGILEEHDTAPSSKQIKEMKAFLDYGVTDNDLKPCYQIMVSHTTARYFDDLATTLAEMNKRSGICKYYV